MYSNATAGESESIGEGEEEWPRERSFSRGVADPQALFSDVPSSCARGRLRKQVSLLPYVDAGEMQQSGMVAALRTKTEWR